MVLAEFCFDNEIVPEGLEDAAGEGADACPQNAIKLVAA